MRTFREYLTEHFLQGTQGSFGYTEIFKNPTFDELKEVGKRQTAPIDLKRFGHDFQDGTISRGTQTWFMGGILTRQNLYIFDRNKAEHAEVYRALLAEKHIEYTQAVPLHLYYFPSSKTLAMAVATYTASLFKMGQLDAEVFIDRCMLTCDALNNFADVVDTNGRSLR